MLIEFAGPTTPNSSLGGELVLLPQVQKHCIYGLPPFNQDHFRMTADRVMKSSLSCF
ncbi:hypothetical protein SAMN04487941_1937 [Pontibacter akesuensis]|uniref:Uncharacterized protein n=1 Tax=Pontibacter akesuensis TaxID=388950 RepID=A0A1I7I5W6_9BACT|nr:hypothetical protein SAMN04487941_1937 [Pontibacter akesuensis]